jgi:hypothetical protein
MFRWKSDNEVEKSGEPNAKALKPKALKLAEYKQQNKGFGVEVHNTTKILRMDGNDKATQRRTAKDGKNLRRWMLRGSRRANAAKPAMRTE